MMGSSPALPTNFSRSGFYFSELALQSLIVESLVILGEGAIVWGEFGGQSAFNKGDAATINEFSVLLEFVLDKTGLVVYYYIVTLTSYYTCSTG